MSTVSASSLKTFFLGVVLLMVGQMANAAVITFNMTNVNVNPGDSIPLILQGQNFATGVNGATANGTLGGGVTLSWDPSVLTLPSFTAANIVFPGDEFFGSSVPIVLDNTAGTLSFSVASFIGTSLVDFNIANLTFSALQAGSTAVGITVSLADIWSDGVGAVDVSPTAIGGNVTVTAVPLPTPLLLLLSGLCGVVAIGRARSSAMDGTVPRRLS